MSEVDNKLEMVHWVATDNLQAVKGAIEKLQRKAQRHNLPEPTLKISTTTRIDKVNVFEDGQLVKENYPVQKTMITVTGEFPRFSDYQFLAKIDHIASEAGNVVLTPGQEFEEQLLASGKDFHACGSGCDHCGVNRQRNETFIVKNVKTDKMLQVGSSCVDDYVGSKTLPQLMAAFDVNSIMYNVEYFDGMNEDFAQGAYKHNIHARLFLAIAIEDIDNSGFRASKDSYPTWRHVTNCLYDPKDLSYSGDEKGVIRAEMNNLSHPSLDKADKVYEWLMAQDGVEQKSMFIRNLQTILFTGYFDPVNSGGRWAAMVASVPHAYNKEMALKQDIGKTANEPFGAVKARGRLKLSVRKMVESDEHAPYPFTKIAFVDNDGRSFAWKASGYNTDVKIGGTYELTGTIKSHSEFRGIHYTHLSRCSDFDIVEPDAPAPDFSAKVKPAAKPKIMLDDASIGMDFSAVKLEHQLSLFRTWKEGRTNFMLNTFVPVNAETKLEDITSQLIDDVDMEMSVHMLAKMKSGKDEVLADVLSYAEAKIKSLQFPNVVLGQISEDVDIQTLSKTYKEEVLTLEDVALPMEMITPEQVGEVSFYHIDEGRKVTHLQHTVDKTLVLSEDNIEQVMKQYHPIMRFNEKLKEEGYGRVVIDVGYEKRMLLPVNSSDRLGIPKGVEILHRTITPEPASLDVLKGKKALIITADSEVDVSSASIKMLRDYAEGEMNGHVILPHIATYGKNINDDMSHIVEILSAEQEGDFEAVRMLGMYPDMLNVLRDAGLDARHIHVSTNNPSSQPFISKLVSDADMTISLNEGVKLSEVVADYSTEIRNLVQTFSAKVPEVVLTKELAQKMVRGCDALLDFSCSPLKDWNNERVNRVTEVLIDDVAQSLTGKPIGEVAEFFKFSDEAKGYAASFAKDELGVVLSFDENKVAEKLVNSAHSPEIKVNTLSPKF